MTPDTRTRAGKIAEIHDERARNAASAGEIGIGLSEISAALERLDQVRMDLLSRVEGDAVDMLSSLAVPLGELSERVAREQAALDRVLARLRRPTLNIGIVGRARQGKSRFLQSLTGLSSREIPDGSGQFCTGVPSTILHVPGTETYADVFFHSEASFLGDVVGPYYARLGLGPAPGTLAEFKTRPFPALPPGASPKAQSEIGHLRKYHQLFGEYEKLIGATSPRRIPAGQIRSYVAQVDESGTRPFQAFRAVRRVQISTRFPRSDLARIGVIDLPGLGDTNLSDSRILLAALKDDVDIVVFLRRPNPEGDAIHEYDVDLYGIAKSALPEIPMERRSFLILNHRRSQDQDNLARCEAFRDQVADSPIRVIRTTIADCSSPDEVDGAFGPVVDYLLANIRELDRLLLEERTRHVAEIRQEARLLARDAAKLAALAQPAGVWFTLFQSLFGTAYKALSVGLEELVAACREERDKSERHLEKAVETALQRAKEDTGIPQAPEIRASFALYGGRLTAYNVLLDETRSHLSRHFLGLDTALRETVERMWDKVAGVLRDAGQLAPLSDEEGVDFLRTLAERVPPGVRRDGDSEVQYALRILIGFDLSYRGFIQHRIRPSLDNVYGDTPMIPFPQDGTLPDENSVRDMLESTYKTALAGCALALKDLLAEPNRAIFAIVEEFRDRVLRSRDIKDEWRAIYEDIRAEIWAGQFAALAENAVHLRTWNEAVGCLTGTLGADPAGGPAARPDEPSRAGTAARRKPAQAGGGTPSPGPASEKADPAMEKTKPASEKTAAGAARFTVVSISGPGKKPG
jgi:hypothetical protein